MKKITFLSLIMFLFISSNSYAEEQTVLATVDEINQYLPADLKSQLNKGEMLLNYLDDEVKLLSRSEVLKYVTIKKTNYKYMENGKERYGVYYYVMYLTDQVTIMYPIGDYRTKSSYWKANYFGCFMTPMYSIKNGKMATQGVEMERSGICANDKFYRWFLIQ